MESQESTVTILHEAKEWETQFDEPVKEVWVDGKKLNDVHDLTLKTDSMTSIIKVLAFAATFLAILAVGGMGYIGFWLANNKEQIALHMDTTEHRFSKKIAQLQSSNAKRGNKLLSLGWFWDNKANDWQQIGNTIPKASK